ncbi:transporter [Peribacillus cavernae]|uniref:Transporter n=2 Tax=Peribacillus cavernae TaxID=1674310 RepID=A0A3S0UFS7_9BACI|nr:transporter [Peribacillus cavernae]
MFPYDGVNYYEPQNNHQQDEFDYGRNTPPRPPFQGGPGYEGYPPPRPPFQGGSGYGGPQGGPPTSPPPSFVPQTAQQIGIQAVDPGALRGCLYRYTYVWLRNGRSFWFYPIFIGRNSVAGFRWRQNSRRWVYFGIDSDLIRSFQCY